MMIQMASLYYSIYFYYHLDKKLLKFIPLLVGHALILKKAILHFQLENFNRVL